MGLAAGQRGLDLLHGVAQGLLDEVQRGLVGVRGLLGLLLSALFQLAASSTERNSLS